MMASPVTRRPNPKATAAPRPPPLIDRADRLSKLPDEILVQILSSLPAQEAVRTSVLGRAWRDVWKSTRRLRITGDTVHEVRDFVDGLLRVRLDGLHLAPLDAAEISFATSEVLNDDGDPAPDLDAEDTSSLNGWIRRVLECRVQTLRIGIDAQGHLGSYLQMGNDDSLVSRHLTRLELTGVRFVCRCLDLDDGCPALEHLEIGECYLEGVRRITSLSLRRLVVTFCDSNGDRPRIWICAPRLASLWLHHNSVRTPILERMPELVEANVRISSFVDNCHCEHPMACFHVMRAREIFESYFEHSDDEEQGPCYYAGQNTTKCLVLEGLAQAEDLVLIADRSMFIFRNDLRWCPTFSKLKTLVLNHDYWCQPDDCSALACILEHAPHLEKLTLISHQVLPTRGKYKVEMKGHPDANATKKSNKISQYLKIVEVNCEDVDERFLNLLNFFGALNICFEIKVTKE